MSNEVIISPSDAFERSPEFVYIIIALNDGPKSRSDTFYDKMDPSDVVLKSETLRYSSVSSEGGGMCCCLHRWKI